MRFPRYSTRGVAEADHLHRRDVRSVDRRSRLDGRRTAGPRRGRSKPVVRRGRVARGLRQRPRLDVEREGRVAPGASSQCAGPPAPAFGLGTARADRRGPLLGG